MAFADDVGFIGQDTEHALSNQGPLSSDSNPLFETQLNVIKVKNTRIRTTKTVPHVAFILGHQKFGTLGSIDGDGGDPGVNQLGAGSVTETLFEVKNYNDTFEELFNNDRFLDDLDATTLDTTNRELIF